MDKKLMALFEKISEYTFKIKESEDVIERCQTQIDALTTSSSLARKNKEDMETKLKTALAELHEETKS